MSTPFVQSTYQPFGDLYIDFEGHDRYTDYRRELNLRDAVQKVCYKVNNVSYIREIVASYPAMM